MACPRSLLLLLVLLLAIGVPLARAQHWSHGWYPGGKRELDLSQAPQEGLQPVWLLPRSSCACVSCSHGAGLQTRDESHPGLPKLPRGRSRSALFVSSGFRRNQDLWRGRVRLREEPKDERCEDPAG